MLFPYFLLQLSNQKRHLYDADVLINDKREIQHTKIVIQPTGHCNLLFSDRTYSSVEELVRKEFESRYKIPPKKTAGQRRLSKAEIGKNLLAEEKANNPQNIPKNKNVEKNAEKNREKPEKITGKTLKFRQLTKQDSITMLFQNQGSNFSAIRLLNDECIPGEKVVGEVYLKLQKPQTISRYAYNLH